MDIKIAKTIEIPEKEFKVWICQLETLQSVSGSAILDCVVKDMKKKDNSSENPGIST